MIERKNDIEEPLCSYEVSKALKKAGFDVPCFYYYVLEGFGFNKTEIPVKASTPSDCPSIFQKVKRGKQPHLAQAPTYSLAILWCSVNLGITLIPEYFFYDGIHCGYKWFSRDGSWGEIWKENEDAPSGCLSIEEASEFALLEILKKENGEI
jgi:hypothetical protein